MLKLTKSVTLEGKSMVEGRQLASFVARIQEDNPKQMTFDPRYYDMESVWEHMTEINQDMIAFQQEAMKVQQSMMVEV